MWNRYPDWSQAQAAGVRFVIAKATQGRTWVDPSYARNKAQAEALGIAFTAYHYAVPGWSSRDARVQADHFVATAALGGKNLVPALDLEKTGGLPPTRLQRWVKMFLEEVEARLGVKPLIYTSPSFWHTYMANTTWFADNGYRLWIAHWGVPQPRVPANGWSQRGWTFWQQSSSGTIDGFSGHVDHDVLFGASIKALRIRNNLTTPAPSPSPSPTPIP